MISDTYISSDIFKKINDISFWEKIKLKAPLMME